MAKRKRLTPARSAIAGAIENPGLETKAMPFGPMRPPVAQVAGDASSASALEELSREWRAAREEGRLIQPVPIDAVETGHLIRDRVAADEEEMRVLMESLAARGQQMPVEVVDLGGGRYGLISGWRRVEALKRLQEETGEARFATVEARLRRPEGAAEAYLAMVEENEIRVGLSYYERARVAAKAVEQGVFPTEKAALLALFAAASRARRSKIRSFLPIYHALGEVLRFAPAIPERLGLALSKGLEEDATLAERLRVALAEAAPETAAAELAMIEATLKGPKSPPPRPAPPLAAMAGVELRRGWSGGHETLTLSGPGVTRDLQDEILALLERRAR